MKWPPFPLPTIRFLTNSFKAQQAPTAATPQDPARTDWADLAHYATANQRLAAPVASRPRVVLLGDSITDVWPKADPTFFANKTYEYVGRGISGQTSPQMLLRFDQDVLSLRPTVMAILAGTNDVAENTGPYNQQDTMNNILSMAKLAQTSGVRVILCSVLPASEFHWRKGLTPGPKILALNEQLKAYARQQQFTYLDYHTAMADDQQGLNATLAYDGVHPTLAGYQVMGPLLQQAVAEALKQKQK